MANYIGLWDAVVTWYYLSAACPICFDGQEYAIEIHGFRPNWLCLILKVLANWATCSSYIRLLLCYQLHLYISHNKCFWLFSWHHGLLRNRNAHIPQLDYVSRSTVSESIHNMSVHQLPRYYQTCQIAFTAWTASVRWYKSK